MFIEHYVMTYTGQNIIIEDLYSHPNYGDFTILILESYIEYCN